MQSEQDVKILIDATAFERAFLTVLEKKDPTAIFNDINSLIDLHQKLYHKPVDLKKLFAYNPAAQENFDHIIHQQWLSISFADAKEKWCFSWGSYPYRFDPSSAGLSFIATLKKFSQAGWRPQFKQAQFNALLSKLSRIESRDYEDEALDSYSDILVSQLEFLAEYADRETVRQRITNATISERKFFDFITFNPRPDEWENSNFPYYLRHMRVYPLLRALLQTKLFDANMRDDTNVNAPLLVHIVRFIQLSDSRNKDRLIKLLIDHGADPEARDNYGRGANACFPHADQNLDASYVRTMSGNTNQVLYATLYLSSIASRPSSYPTLSSPRTSSSSLCQTLSSSSTSSSSLYPILSLAEENDLTQLVATILMADMPSREKWQNLNALSRYFLFNHTIESHKVDLKRLMKNPSIKKAFLNLFLDYLNEDYLEPLCFLENFYSAEELKGLDLLSPLEPDDLDRLVSTLHKIPLNVSHIATRTRCALISSEEHLRILKHTDTTNPESILERAVRNNHWSHLIPLLHNVAPSEAGEIINFAWPILLKKLYAQQEIYCRERTAAGKYDLDAKLRGDFAMASISTMVNTCLHYSLKYNVTIYSFTESCIIKIIHIDDLDLLQNLCAYITEHGGKLPDGPWFINLLNWRGELLQSLFFSKEESEIFIKKIRVLCDNFPELQRHVPDLYPSSFDGDKQGSTPVVADKILAEISDFIATPAAGILDSATDLWSNFSPFSASSSNVSSSSKFLSAPPTAPPRMHHISQSTNARSTSSSSSSSSSTFFSASFSGSSSNALSSSAPVVSRRNPPSYEAPIQEEIDSFIPPPTSSVPGASAQSMAELIKLPPPLTAPPRAGTSTTERSRDRARPARNYNI